MTASVTFGEEEVECDRKMEMKGVISFIFVCESVDEQGLHFIWEIV